MSLKQLGYGGKSVGSLTQTAGTTIEHLCQPDKYGFTRVARCRYLCGSTAHNLTCLRPLGNTTASAAAAISQAVVNFTADPGAAISNAIAANDWVAIRHSADGITRLYKVSSVSTLAITMTANLTVAVAAGDKIWFFGVAADTDPRAGSAHPVITAVVSVVNDFNDDIAGVFQSIAIDEPLLIQSNNATAAGTLQNTTYAYTKV